MHARLWYMTRYSFRALVREGDTLSSYAARRPILDSPEADIALILTEGHIRVVRSGCLQPAATVEVVNPGEIIGLVQASRQGYDRAEAMEECCGYLVHREELERRAAEAALDESWVRAGLHGMIVANPVAPMLFQPLEQRLAALLTRLEGGGGAPRLAYWQLADLVNANRALVRLTLDAWAAEGAIERHSGRLRLRAAARLPVAGALRAA